jgi:hypothetical protein
MRLTILVLTLLLLLGTVSFAQTSSPIEASPAAMASPGPNEGMMGQPPMGWAQPHPPWFGYCPRPARTVRIVAFVLRALLALSAIFALTALGIFLIRRSKPRP